MVEAAAGSHEVVIHDMNKSDIASKAKQYGFRMLEPLGNRTAVLLVNKVKLALLCRTTRAD